jgi:hypothetical protein
VLCWSFLAAEQCGQSFRRADTFWRKLVLPQEERMRLGIPWYGGYRWFKSPNVVPIEKYRKPKGHGAGIGGE